MVIGNKMTIINPEISDAINEFRIDLKATTGIKTGLL